MAVKLKINRSPEVVAAAAITRLQD